jgi:hypothetical protein
MSEKRITEIINEQNRLSNERMKLERELFNQKLQEKCGKYYTEDQWPFGVHDGDEIDYPQVSIYYHVIEIRADQCFCFEFRIYERFDEHDEKWIDKSINAAYGLIEVGHLWEEIPKEEYDREFKQFQENYQSVLNEETE